jgi:nucleotide-binding universal stress UspA family protein
VEQDDFESATDGPSVMLIGVDESVTARRAAWYACGLARRQGCRVVAVYVAPYCSAVVVTPQGAVVAAAEQEMHNEIADELGTRAAALGQELGIAVTFIVAFGDPYREISRIAAETRADAIVVGSSLKAGHRLMGSLAVRLVRAGKWPVTVVP